ncbi:hypothetical protein [Deinococcus sp. 6GRE01]|uniref:hypothetical protein n=1 Tax=Deinococcus sp. 6GRE01 TaxID=2745873 RepID=UPI001E4254CE|nr:hypothetical protein [Deinococcus sp. 6GRE01]MCD0155987.1 hypothetical protein [Deinococcus sp. 6GRE01]
MTAARTLIDPNTLAQFQAAKQRGEIPDQLTPPEGCALSVQRARRLTPAEWKRGWSDSLELVTEIVQNAHTRDDGTEIGAQLVDRVLDLLAFGLTEFAGTSPDPRRAVREKTELVLNMLWDNVKETIAAGVEEYRGELQRELEGQLAVEREQMTRAADQAQADATEYRRLLDAASAQMIRERTAHADALAALRDQMQRERDAVIVRERAWNEERRQLTADKTAAQDLAASLNRDLDTLTTRLEELTMPAPTALERTSLCLYARTAMSRPDLTQADLPEVPEHVRTAWQAALPTPADQMAQLRAVALPILGRTA